MQYALVGQTGLRVSRIALGTALFGLAPAEDACDTVVHTAVELGINLFDCANTYGNRASFDRDGLPAAAQRRHAEELLGRAVKGLRDDVVICTKVSEPVGDGVNDAGLSRYHIMREAEQSLRRLGTDHIDIYHLHHPCQETALDETLRAMDDLVHQGKVRYVALSTYPGWQMTKAVMTADRDHLARPVLNQVWYNLLQREVEADVVPAALDLDLSLTCFSPLAGGALAGTEVMDRRYSGLKRWGLPFDYTPDQRNAATKLQLLAAEWGHAPAHLAIRWLLSRPAVASAIVGPETAEELERSVAAIAVELDAGQLTVMDGIGQVS